MIHQSSATLSAEAAAFLQRAHDLADQARDLLIQAGLFMVLHEQTQAMADAAKLAEEEERRLVAS